MYNGLKNQPELSGPFKLQSTIKKKDTNKYSTRFDCHFICIIYSPEIRDENLHGKKEGK